MPRHKIDWESIRKEYRVGQLSIREIARQYGVSEGAIRKKAKKYGWQRDLTAKVNSKVAELVRTEVRTPNTQEDANLIDQAADRALKVVELHRKDAKELRRSWNKIKNIVFSRIPKDGNGLDFNDLREMSMILQRGSYVVDKIVRIERDAFGLSRNRS